MAITIFTIQPMSASSKRVFSSAKHTIALECTSLGATVIEQTECLKSWLLITLGRLQALLSGIFINRHNLDKVVEVLQQQDKGADDVVDNTANMEV
jgi:hypothetical protein